MSHLIQNMSLRRRSSQTISWFSTEETKPKTTKANKMQTKSHYLKQKKKIQKLNLNLNQQSTTETAHLRVCISLCTNPVHNTAQIISSRQSSLLRCFLLEGGETKVDGNRYKYI